MKNLCTKLSILLLISSAPLVISMDKKSPPPPPTLNEAKSENKTDIVSILREQQKFTQQATDPITVGQKSIDYSKTIPEIAAQDQKTDSAVINRREQAIFDQVREVEKNAAIANAQHKPVNSSAAIIAEAHRKLDHPKQKKHSSKHNNHEHEIVRFSRYCSKITKDLTKAEIFLNEYSESKDKKEDTLAKPLKLKRFQSHIIRLYAIYNTSKNKSSLLKSPHVESLKAQWELLDTVEKKIIAEFEKNNPDDEEKNLLDGTPPLSYFRNLTLTLEGFEKFMKVLQK